MTIPKTIPIGWVAAGVFLVLFLYQCGKGREPIKEATKDTGTYVQQVPQPVVQAPVTNPQPIIIMPPSQQQIPVQYREPSTNLTELTRQVKELAAALYSSRVYRDSLQLRDSAGNRVGVFNYNDSVSQNEIVQRQPSYQLSFPHTTRTITVTQPAESKRQVYATGGLTWPIGAEVGLLYKDRSDRMFMGGAGVTVDGKTYGKVGLGWKIKLKR